MTIDELRRTRPREAVARVSVLAMAVLVGYAWLAGDLELGRLFSARSASNLERFLGEIRPYPLWGQPWDWGVAGRWLGSTLEGAGGQAVLSTVALSVASICLAAVLALFLCVGDRDRAGDKPCTNYHERPSLLSFHLSNSLIAVDGEANASKINLTIDKSCFGLRTRSVCGSIGIAYGQLHAHR